jgi:pimeloyl-ACP methyl ester carboxylesterase
LKIIQLTLAAFIILSGLYARPGVAQTAQSDAHFNGNWQGVLKIAEANLRLRLVLKVTAAQNGTLTASMDSLDQPNSNDLKIDTITLQNGALHFEMKAIRAVYDGSFYKTGEMVGTFTQGGFPRRLIFRREGFARPSTAVKRGRLELKPCDDPDLTSDMLCGRYEVFEDRAARSGRRISLDLMLLPALSATPAPDPVFFMAGGPGGAATSYATEKFMDRLRRNRDVVLLDQRGTGQANLLDCPASGSIEDIRGFFGEVMPLDRIRACRAELEKIADLKLYTTTIAMDDMDEVREALRYDRINVYGGSYGSTATLAYLRQYPKHVRTIAVFGVAPFTAKIPLSFSKGVQGAIDRLFADCAADSACHTAYPDLANEFKSVIAQFDKGPIQVSAVNPYTGSTQEVTVTRDAFVDSVRLMLYFPALSAALPALIHLGAKGNLAPWISNAVVAIMGINIRLARGMQFSVVCSEDVPFITAEEVKTTSANSFYGDARVRPTMRACTEWPQGRVSPSFLDPVKADTPALLIAGQLDPVTPPWLAETVSRTLSHSRLVIIPNATHTSYDCVYALVAEFIDKGTADGLDVSCINQIKRPPFTIIKE